jgi:hypothetical protein
MGPTVQTGRACTGGWHPWMKMDWCFRQNEGSMEAALDKGTGLRAVLLDLLKRAGLVAMSVCEQAKRSGESQWRTTSRRALSTRQQEAGIQVLRASSFKAW